MNVVMWSFGGQLSS